MNLTLSATLSISVLYAQERLGLGSVGYGLLISSMAVGGIAASLVAERLIGWLGPATTMRLGLIVETSTHLTLACWPLLSSRAVAQARAQAATGQQAPMSR